MTPFLRRGFYPSSSIIPYILSKKRLIFKIMYFLRKFPQSPERRLTYSALNLEYMIFCSLYSPW